MDPLRSSEKDSPTNYSIQTPFRTNNHFDTYSRVLQGELQFLDDPVMDQDTKSLIHDVSVMRWFALRTDHRYRDNSFFTGIPL